MNKKKMLKLLYIYIGILAVVIFFSKTIYNFSLPSVTIGSISSGSLEKKLESYGEVTFSKTYDIFAETDGQISAVYCNENEEIQPSAEIVKIENTDSHELAVINLELQSLDAKINHQRKKVDNQRVLQQMGDISQWDYEVTLAELKDLENQREIKNVMKQKQFQTQVVTSASVPGVVLEMHVQLGEFVAKGTKIATIGVVDEGFCVEIVESKDKASFINLDDKASFRVNGISADAVVSSIQADGENINISFAISSDSLKGGEYGKISLSKITPEYNTLILNEAVVREEYNSYVWVLRSRFGSLGKEHYAIKTKVFIADYDENYTAISNGLYYGDHIIIDPSSELESNKRVIPQ